MGEFPNKETQFNKDNQPLNKGRPKGALSLTTILKTMLENDLVEYKDARGKVYKINKAKAINLKLLEKALKGEGDLGAIRDIFNRVEGTPNETQHVTVEQHIYKVETKNESDREEIENFINEE